jgi:VanZ family protein
MPAEQEATRPAAPPASATHVTRHVSTFARVGLLMYGFLIVYASLYPLSGWRSIGLPFWTFLFQSLPYYWTGFDVITNVIGYFPFGMLTVFALFPAVRGPWAAAIAIVAGTLLSGSMEALQTYLPTRVSSNLDLLTNSAGTCLGALAALPLSRPFLEESRLLQLRKAWFLHDAGPGLMVLALWPLAQIYPQGYLFGHGQLIPVVSEWLSDFLNQPIDLGSLLREDLHFSAQEYWLGESVITACGLTGALLSGTCLLRKQAPKGALVLLLLVTALLVKTLTSALFFAPENALVWLTPGAKGGMLFAGMMLAGLVYAPPVAQRRVATACLTVSFVALNIVPTNPYFASTLQTWVQGKFLNFNGAAQFLSLTWQFFALWFLLHPMHRMKPD